MRTLLSTFVGLSMPVALLGMTSLLLASGCARPDVTMKNPVASGQLEAKHLVKEHGFTESGRGLPVGSMSDEAFIDSADAKQICINVSLHELAAIDLKAAEIKITSNTGTLLQPPLDSGPPTSQTYQGLVPHEEQTGTREECKTVGQEVVCEKHPIITTTMIPGPVEVYGTKGRVCAPNQNLVTAQTTELALRVGTPTSQRAGFMGMGRGSKKVEFRWAFAK